MYILGITQIWAWVKLGALKYFMKPGWSWYMAWCQTWLKSVVLWVLCFEPYPGDTDTNYNTNWAIQNVRIAQHVQLQTDISMLLIQQPVHVDEHIHSLCFFSSVVASLLNIILIIYIDRKRERVI
jgi:hypothetical protein